MKKNNRVSILEKDFLVTLSERFKRIHENFKIMIKKMERKKTLMMLGVGDDSARLIIKKEVTQS